MENNYLKLFFLLLIALVLQSCADKNKKRATELQNEAMELYQNNFYGGHSDMAVNEYVLTLLDSAMCMDSSNLVIHSNKINMLYDLERYPEVIAAAKKAMPLKKNLEGGTWLLLGDCYSKMNMKDSSIICYQNALKIIKEHPRKGKNQDLFDLADILLLEIKLGYKDEEAAIYILDKAIKKEHDRDRIRLLEYVKLYVEIPDNE